MKKIIAIVLNFLTVILTGITFGLGALPFLYAFEKNDPKSAFSNATGNFYQNVWVNEKASVGLIVLFFLLCVGALVVTVTLAMNKKKFLVVNILGALLLLGAGVLFFLAPQLFAAAHETNIPYVLGEGAISMGVLTLVAGAFQVVKVALTAKEE